jgi:TRAP transporter 4TM/12TM fusion protein
MLIEEKKYNPSLPWHLRSARTKLACFVGASWTIYIILHLFKFFFYTGIVIYPIAHRAVSAGAIIILALLTIPAKKDASLHTISWYDALLIVVTLIGCGYVAVYSPVFVYKWGDATPMEMVIALSMSLAMLEAVRRTTGWALVFFILAGFFYIVYSDYFPGFLMGAGYSYERTIGWIYLSGEGYWGAILGAVATTVPGFILFGTLLEATGASTFFGDLAFAALGSTRGGPAKAAVLSSCFMGSISGSIAANVATTGQITIPMMKKNGYSDNMAGAVEAVASTGGMFTPPVMGATAFLIADFLGISYWAVCVGAFLPAVLYYATVLFAVDIEAVKIKAWGLPRSELPKASSVLVKGWFYLVPFIVLVLFMGVFQYSAETTIMYTLIVMVICASLTPAGRLNLKKILWILESTAKGMLSIIPVCTGIGIVVAALTITGTGANLSAELSDVAGKSILLMLLFAGLASFVLGMGMTAVSCYLLTVTLLAPGLIEAGINPLAAHMFLFYYGCLSFITPPVAVAAYVAAGISGGNPYKTGLHAMRLGIVAFLLPWKFVMNPALLWQHDSLLSIALAFAFSILSLFCLCIGFAGHFRQKLHLWQTVVCFTPALAFIMPHVSAYRGILIPILCLWLLYLFKSQKPVTPSGLAVQARGE